MSWSAELTAALALLEAEVEADIAAHAAPGLSLAVAHGDEVWARGVGLADIERRVAAAPGTVYAVGSITKLFTATMLLQLRDAGLVRLDDAVQEYVPEAPVPRRHPDAPPITFRHLVTHTAGLEKDAPLGYWGSWDFPPAERVVDALADAVQPYPPGRRWKYSNWGVALLGYTLARVAGAPWEEYIEEHILRPLGMVRSAPRLNAAVRPWVATGYHRPVAGWPPAPLATPDLGGVGSAGSLHASAEDLAVFVAEQWREQPTVLRRSTVEEMQRLQWVNPDWQGGQAIGWRVRRGAIGTLLEHGGGVYGFTTSVLVSPADRLAAIVCTNGSDGRLPARTSARALDLLAPIVRRAAERARSVPAAPLPADWQRYVGRYRWVLGDMDVIAREGALVLSLPGPVGREEVVLHPEGEGVFAMRDGPLHGEQLRFVTSPDGRIERAWVGPHPYDAVG